MKSVCRAKKMEFKKPQPLKRRSDGDEFNSPCNRKKTRSLSPTIATPKLHKTEPDPFDDNFSQFFQSQFIKQIPELDMSLAQNANKNPSKTEYNFTQFDGLSQFSYESQLDSTIPVGQRCIASEVINRDSDEQTEQNGEQSTGFRYDQNDNQQTSNDDENEKNEAEGELSMQCSQLFLKELSNIRMNISSIVNDTINASKFTTEDFLDPANDQYEVYKSTVTQSQYMHRKRPNDEPMSATDELSAATATPKNELKATSLNSTLNSQTNLNTEMMDDQLLAEMKFTTQMLAINTEFLEDQLLAEFKENDEPNVSDQVSLNDCIDPDSSALAALSDEDDKENIENVKIVTRIVNTSVQRDQQIHLNVKNDLVQTIRRSESVHHSPVTASNFFSMGPFFGLPNQVKKLIKTFKNIDDLYGK